jgi:SAM-dependent methyltransferase
MIANLKNLMGRTETGRRLLKVARACRGDNLLTDYEILKSLRIFAANSHGAAEVMAPYALSAARQTFPFMVDALIEAGIALPPPQKIVEVFPETDSLADTHDLGAYFNKYGSDKASYHDYHRVYAPLMSANRNNSLRLLEIGLGTNNQNIASNMGPDGRPGGSLRAFRDFLPNALLFGADIDRDSLFREERIETVFVDQTEPKTFDELLRLGNDFDIVIDDGLHSPDANLATMSFALRALKPGGIFIIEDITNRSILIWQVMGCLLRAYSPTLIDAKNGYLFIMTKLAQRNPS